MASALAVIRAVRTHTSLLLDHAPADLWARKGQHSESGAYTAEDWLTSYGAHLQDHAAQIRHDLECWHSSQA